MGQLRRSSPLTTTVTGRRRPLLVAFTAAALLCSVLVVGAVAPETASAAAPFTTRGSVGQIYTWGHPVGSTVELHDPSNAVLATGTADAQGAFLFRNLAAGPGYTVAEGGATSDPVTVSALGDNPTQAFYNGISLHEGYGYLPTRDGTTLSINVTFPKDGSTGPWPVLVDYSGYDPSQPGTTPQEAQIYPYFGYVVVAVNMRGTTCSGGAFWFFEDAQRTDGYDAIEAVAAQPWSNGNVGMVGISYSGYSQLYVAATRPPHLRAITPLSPFSDGYRGILYPGGILNNGFALNWALDRQEASSPAAHQWVKDRINGGDTTCRDNQVMRLQSQNLQQDITPGHFDDPQYAYLDPSTFAPNINVPTYLATQWQDEQTGGYGAELATTIAQHTYLRAEFTNGTHVDPLGPEEFLRVAEFIDFYVGQRVPHAGGNAFYRQGIESGLQSIFGVPVTLAPNRFTPYTDYGQALAVYQAEAPVRIRFENGAVAGKEGQPYASGAYTYSAWPIPQTAAQRWYLQPDGQLASTAPDIPTDQPRGASSYTYDPTSKRAHTSDGSTESQWLSHPDVHWNAEPEGKSLSFTTPAYGVKTAYAGTGSVDLWLRSSAADTDVEVSLTEVRPDGKEVYIQSGFLRASRRALDVSASTPLRPRQTFQAGDAAPLPAGQFVPVRIELFPFAHIVRPGSRLRLNIAAPGGNQPFWAYDALTGTSVNDIGHAVGMPSSVALPLLTDYRAAFYASNTAPSCAVSGVSTQSQSLRNQPCRGYQPARVPTAVKAVPGPGGVTVSWLAPPAWTGSGSLTGYRVYPSVGSPVDVGAGATTATVPTNPNQSVTYRVAAKYGAVEAPQSDASDPVSASGPTAVAAKPGNASAVVTWLAPAGDGAVTGYTITPYVGGTAQTPKTFASTATTQTFTGLTNGVTYTFDVAATHASGTGPRSPASGPVLVGSPQAPVFQSATPRNASAQVQWWPPANNGSAITGYVVTPYIGLAAQPQQTFNGPANSVLVTGLTNGTAYTFTISARNGVGLGPASNPTAAVTPAAAAPGSPSSVSARPGNGQAVVSWTAPTDPGGSSITGYQVIAYPTGSAPLPPVTFGPSARSGTVPGLVNGASYTFAVAAVNGSGPGTASAPSAPIWVGAPNQPGFQSASAGPASGQARVQWWPPSGNGASVTGYTITPYVNGVAQPPQSFGPGSNVVTLVGLAPGTTYTFTVVANSTNGPSVASGPTNAVTVP